MRSDSKRIAHTVWRPDVCCLGDLIVDFEFWERYPADEQPAMGYLDMPAIAHSSFAESFGD